MAVQRYGNQIMRAGIGGGLLQKALKGLLSGKGKAKPDKKAIGATGQGFTSQYHDHTRTYRRKRAPRRVRTYARKAYKRHVVGNLRDISGNVFKYNAGGVDTATVDTMGFRVIPGLYSAAGNTEGWDDVNQMIIMKGNEVGGPSGMSGTQSFLDRSKLFFTSALMELDFSNTSSVGMVAYLYKCQARRGGSRVSGASPNDFVSMSSIFYDAVADAEVTQLTTTDQGVSLFDMPKFTSNFVILSVDKFNVGSGQTIEVSHKDRRDRVIDVRDINGTTGSNCIIPGVTTFYVVMWQGQLQNNAGSARYAECDLTWKIHRTYNVKFMDTTPISNTVILQPQNQ